MSTERRRSHVDTNPPPQSEVLVECTHCGRTFAEDRINRHMEVRAIQIQVSLVIHGVTFLKKY